MAEDQTYIGEPRSLIPADNLGGLRAAGYLLDLIPGGVLALLVGWIPVLGLILAGLLLTPYWLLRDVTGRSPGKLLLGLQVANIEGGPAPVGARILRNLPIAAGPMMMIIPVLGYVLAPIVSVPLMLTEMILTLSSGQRLGDRIAHTIVVRKPGGVRAEESRRRDRD